MGGCCGRDFADEEIDGAKTLNDLIEILNKRRENFSTEISQIEGYLEDPNKEVDVIDVKGIEPSILEKRVPFLKDLDNAYAKVAEILYKNPSLPLNDTKNYVTDIVSHYFQTYDPNGDLPKDISKFEEFVDKNKESSS